MTIPTDDITGLILAGGRATRMGGVDKGLQLLNGEPMVSHVLRRLSPQVGTLMINANRNADLYQQFGATVIADQLPDFAGPLAGLQAGLAQCKTPYLATAPCDAPRIPADLVARLSATLKQYHSDAAVAVTLAGSRRHRHPVCMLVKTSVLPHLTAWLDNGGRKMDDWLRSLPSAETVFDDEDAFENVNTIAQLGQLERSAHDKD